MIKNENEIFGYLALINNRMHVGTVHNEDNVNHKLHYLYDCHQHLPLGSGKMGETNQKKKDIALKKIFVF